MSDEELLKAFAEISAGLGWTSADLEHIDVLTRTRDLVALAEEEIARRGLQENYINHLIDAANAAGIDTRADEIIASLTDVFALVAASPEARVRAMLQVLEEATQRL
jgi:hypothetical protein